MPDTATVPSEFDQILDVYVRLVEGVRPEQWNWPTPCEGWDVRQLVSHVTTGTRMIAAIARGEWPEGPEALPEFRARLTPAVGDDLVEATVGSMRELRESISRPGFLTGRYPTFMGEREGGFLIQMRTSETLIHGWDLARATGQPAAFPERATEETLAAMRASLAGHPRGAGTFGTEQTIAADAPVIDRLAAFVGRTV